MCRQRKTTLIQVLGTVRRDIFPSLSNLFRCGLVDSLVCQFCPKRGIIGAHQQLSQGLGIRTVSLVPYPSSVGSSRQHLHWHHQKQEATSNKVHHCLCSSRGEASAPAKVLGWAACNSKKLAVPGRPTGLRFHHSYRTHAKMVLMSVATKKVVLLQLTIPWEELMEEPQKRKRAWYSDLVAVCRRNGWKARCEPGEVGCGAFAGQSLHWVL